MPDSLETALGIDIGGGHCRAAVVDGAGAIQSFHTCSTPNDHDSFLDAIGRLARQVTESSKTSCETAGVGLPGIVDAETGIMRCAVNLPILEGMNVSARLADAIGRPVRIEVDVNAAAFAQWRRRCSAAQRFAYVSIGTGAGAGVVLDGNLLCHTDRGAGHWGHLTVDSTPDAPVCRCGARGCLESIVGGPAWDAADSDDARDRDRRADALAIGCLHIAAVYAPQVIALGGGVVDARPELVRAVAERVESRRGEAVPPAMVIERAVLSSDEAGVIGAALLVMNEMTD